MSKSVLITICPACRCQNHPTYVESNGLNIDKCKGCGLIFTNPRPSEEAIAQHFQNEYIEDEHRFENDFISLREESLHREANRLKGYFPNGAKLLDVGTASGVFLSYFDKAQGWQIEGVEPSRYAAQRASQQWGVPVHQGFLCDQHFPSANFDIISSLDTFYFHPEPNKDLNEIARILRPGGFFVLDIPGLNFRLLKNTGLLSRLLYGVPARLNAGVHLFFYNQHTLSLLLEKHGFDLVKSWPEQSPVYGSAFARGLNKLFYLTTAMVYKFSNGKINLAPKEFLIYRKIK